MELWYILGCVDLKGFVRVIIREEPVSYLSATPKRDVSMCKLNNKKGKVAKKGTKVKMKGSLQNIYLRLISKFKRAKKALGYLKRIDPSPIVVNR